MKKLLLCLGVIGGMIMAASCAESTKKTAKTYPVTLMTIDPGHFHAALIKRICIRRSILRCMSMHRTA